MTVSSLLRCLEPHVTKHSFFRTFSEPSISSRKQRGYPLNHGAPGQHHPVHLPRARSQSGVTWWSLLSLWWQNPCATTRFPLKCSHTFLNCMIWILLSQIQTVREKHVLSVRRDKCGPCVSAIRAKFSLSPRTVCQKLPVPSPGSITFTDKLRGTQLNVKEVRQQEGKRALPGPWCAAEADDYLDTWSWESYSRAFLKKIPRGTPRLSQLLLRLRSGKVHSWEKCCRAVTLAQYEMQLAQQTSARSSCGEAAKDLGVKVCEWLTQGANAGLPEDPQGLEGIFPRAVESDPTDNAPPDEELLARSSAAHDLDAEKQIEDCAKQGWHEKITLHELREQYGPCPICMCSRRRNKAVTKRC